jgi:acyl carrier protein
MQAMTMAEARSVANRRRNVTERLKTILIERLSLHMNPDEIAEDSPLFGVGLGLDSVDALEVVVCVEQEFGVAIMDDDMPAFRSFNTIVDFILSRQTASAASGA